MMTTTEASGNVELLRRGYETFARRDMVALEKIFDPAVVWHAQRLGALGGDHVGWDSVARFFAQTMEMTEGSFHIDVFEMLGNEQGAAAVVRSMARRGDRFLDSREIHHFTWGGGRIVEVWQCVDDAALVDAFWS
jgi:uncharacterized protein